MSIGLAGQWSHPDVVKAEQLTIETALKKGIHPRVEIGDPAEAVRNQEMGVKHFCLGWMSVSCMTGGGQTAGSCANI